MNAELPLMGKLLNLTGIKTTDRLGMDQMFDWFHKDTILHNLFVYDLDACTSMLKQHPPEQVMKP